MPEAQWIEQYRNSGKPIAISDFAKSIRENAPKEMAPQFEGVDDKAIVRGFLNAADDPSSWDKVKFFEGAAPTESTGPPQGKPASQPGPPQKPSVDSLDARLKAKAEGPLSVGGVAAAAARPLLHPFTNPLETLGFGSMRGYEEQKHAEKREKVGVEGGVGPKQPGQEGGVSKKERFADAAMEEIAGLGDALVSPVGLITAGFGPEIRAAAKSKGAGWIIRKLGVGEKLTRLGFGGMQLANAIHSLTEFYEDPTPENAAKAMTQGSIGALAAAPEAITGAKAIGRTAKGAAEITRNVVQDPGRLKTAAKAGAKGFAAGYKGTEPPPEPPKAAAPATTQPPPSAPTPEAEKPAEAAAPSPTGPPVTTPKPEAAKRGGQPKAAAPESTSGKTPTDTGKTSGPRLPEELAGAKPTYNIGLRKHDLNFESDIDRAAYITAKTGTKSKADAQYLKWGMEQTGLTEGEFRMRGRQLRDNVIKELAKGKEHGDTLEIPETIKPRETKAATPSGKLAVTPSPKPVLPKSGLKPKGGEVEPGGRSTEVATEVIKPGTAPEGERVVAKTHEAGELPERGTLKAGDTITDAKGEQWVYRGKTSNGYDDFFKASNKGGKHENVSVGSDAAYRKVFGEKSKTGEKPASEEPEGGYDIPAMLRAGKRDQALKVITDLGKSKQVAENVVAKYEREIAAERPASGKTAKPKDLAKGVKPEILSEVRQLLAEESEKLAINFLHRPDGGNMELPDARELVKQLAAEPKTRTAPPPEPPREAVAAKAAENLRASLKRVAREPQHYPVKITLADALNGKPIGEQITIDKPEDMDAAQDLIADAIAKNDKIAAVKFEAGGGQSGWSAVSGARKDLMEGSEGKR